ncbi:MAG TPA: ATP-binding protein [Planctomycetota bacterium]|nr:ATP-binding protein [Planctomycetota bacterium]
MAYQRPVFRVLAGRLSEPRRFIQVLAGPRQTGKTTLARQVMAGFSGTAHYASADEPALKDRIWIEQQWEVARTRARGAGQEGRALLVLDEVQKVSGWSETVKRLWDEDTAAGLAVHVVVLGSSPLLVGRGLTESLAGRFELIPVTHWSFAEMRDAFGWDMDRYLYFGGYPGAAELVADPPRWARYILDSLIETTVSRDVLLMTRVDKPALLRRLFELGCAYSGQVLSYQKMMGQLQDAGNTVTLAHYLRLLEGAGLLAGLPKYAGQTVRQRASSPKLLALNTALMTATARPVGDNAPRAPEFHGRLVETAVGAALVNGSLGTGVEVYYWAARNHEVDFVLRRGGYLTAIEVKSGRRRASLPGMAAFCKEFRVQRKLLVGAQGIPLEEFLLAPVTAWVE